MKIACLGWGSLIWNIGNLLINENGWSIDGVMLPIEFTRQSNNGRMTLIIDEEAKPIRTLWALMATDNLKEAKESLQKREGTLTKYIHSVKSNENNQIGNNKIIVDWLNSQKLDAAIWTGLSFSDKTKNKRPDIDYVINHLKGLEYNRKRVAEEYIRKAPKQIDTEYRRKIEAELGWTYNEQA